MRRVLIPAVCGWIAVLSINMSLGTAEELGPSEPAPPAAAVQAEESVARVCYWSCDTWTLYTTQEACVEECPSPCGRVCF